MRRLTKQERLERLLDWQPWSPVRSHVCLTLNDGFQGTFDQLVFLTGSKKKRVAAVVSELFEAGLIDAIPQGTPLDVVEASATREVH